MMLVYKISEMWARIQDIKLKKEVSCEHEVMRAGLLPVIEVAGMSQFMNSIFETSNLITFLRLM